MDAVERIATQYPELEPLSAVLRQLSAGIHGFDKPSVKPSAQEDDVRSVIASDLAAHQQVVADVSPEAEQLRTELCDVPLTSLLSLQSQLEAALEYNPDFSSAVCGKDMCKGLSAMLQKAGSAAPPVENNQIERWVQSFVRETMNEFFEHGQQVSKFLEGTMAMEQSVLQKMRALSDQLSSPGFRADRVELMDHRLALVQQLIAGMASKHQAVQDNEARMFEFLDQKLQNFDAAHEASLKEHRERLQHHSSKVEHLNRGMNAVKKYAAQKEAVHASEFEAAQQRREQRETKVQRVTQVLQDSFEHLLKLVEECHADEAVIRRCVLEKNESEAASKHLVERYGEVELLHVSSSLRVKMCYALEVHFAEWLRSAYGGMQAKAKHDAKALRAMLPSNKARIMSLSRSATEQVGAQQEQLKRGLEQRLREVNTRREELSLLEYSKPTDEEIATRTKRIAELKHAAAWQQQELEALDVVEQRLSEQTATFVGDSTLEPGTLGLDSMEQWSKELQSAEEWVAGFFHNRDCKHAPESIDDWKPTTASRLMLVSTPRSVASDSFEAGGLSASLASVTSLGGSKHGLKPRVPLLPLSAGSTAALDGTMGAGGYPSSSSGARGELERGKSIGRGFSPRADTEMTSPSPVPSVAESSVMASDVRKGPSIINLSSTSESVVAPQVARDKPPDECFNCHCVNPSDSVFCRRCGVRLADPEGHRSVPLLSTPHAVAAALTADPSSTPAYGVARSQSSSRGGSVGSIRSSRLSPTRGHAVPFSAVPVPCNAGFQAACAAKAPPEVQKLEPVATMSSSRPSSSHGGSASIPNGCPMPSLVGSHGLHRAAPGASVRRMRSAPMNQVVGAASSMPSSARGPHLGASCGVPTLSGGRCGAPQAMQVGFQFPPPPALPNFPAGPLAFLSPRAPT